MLKAGWLVFPLLPPPPPPPPPPPLFLTFTTSKSGPGGGRKRKKKKKALSLTANSHKFILNMSSIDRPCRMNTIKETVLSAAHLGEGDGRTGRGVGREGGGGVCEAVG